MFPHRTACYNKKDNKIILPEDDPHFYTSPSGNVETSYCGLDRYLIPLASTGLEDSEGNEIFEGHIVHHRYGISVVSYHTEKMMVNYPCFSPFDKSANSPKPKKSTVKGHVLTDPKEVPRPFEVEEYFELEEPIHA